MRHRSHVLTVVAMVAAAACTTSRAATLPRPLGPAPKPTGTTTPVAPQPKPSPHAGFVDAVRSPRPVDTGRDYPTILRSLLEYSNWIVEHDVDAALVANVAAPGSPWAAGLRAEIATAQTRHLHYDEEYGGPSTLTIVSTLPDVVSARYTQPITRQAWLDEHGNAIRDSRPGSPTTTYVVVMALVGRDTWRLVSVEQR